jgi:formylglycine-generating enzyme
VSLAPQWVQIPADPGTFEMLSCPVTQGLYAAVMGANPSRFPWSDAHPVEQVSWLDAAAFCNAWSLLLGRSPVYEITPGGVTWLAGDGIRLPTQAEWTCASDADGTVADVHVDEVAWHGRNSRVDRDDGWAANEGEFWPLPEEDIVRFGTHAVAQKRANAWGLYDMLGNVEEWVWGAPGQGAVGDRIDPQHPGAVLPTRGGSFLSEPELLPGASGRGTPTQRSFYIGFRCARQP